MKSLFNETAYSEILERLEKIDTNTAREWGKMDAAQMMRHCQFPLKALLTTEELKRPNFVMRLVMKSFKASMYNDKPWRKGLPTPPSFRVEDKRDLQEEKTALKSLIDAVHQEKSRTSWKPHPAFGSFTRDQWGQMQYKHLDHHLKQFGV